MVEKTPFSIWRKLQKKVSLEEITDIIGFRVIADSIDNCYKSLGIFIKNIIVYLENLKITYLQQK